MIASYHNHTTWSDGKTSIAEMVDHAAAVGIDALGFSDHFNVHPSGQPPRWAMPLDRLDEYVAEVLGQRGRTAVDIRLGLEVDWWPGRGDAIRAALGDHPYDYLIGAVHEVDGFRIDSTPRDWEALTPDEQDERHRRYWEYQISLARSGLFDLVAHLDLSKKFGHRPRIDLDPIIDEALDAFATAGLTVELNTEGWHKPCREAYPSPDLLERCHARGIPVTLSADAHEPGHLLRDFDRGAARLREAGYEQIARFEGRARTLEDIDVDGAVISPHPQ
jgi:histidinol-phosphatase (PHP family)